MALYEFCDQCGNYLDVPLNISAAFEFLDHEPILCLNCLNKEIDTEQLPGKTYFPLLIEYEDGERWVVDDPEQIISGKGFFVLETNTHAVPNTQENE